MKMRLEISNGLDTPEPSSVSLAVGQTLSIGRSSHLVDIQLTSNAIGKCHCEVGRNPCGVWVRDLNTRNGTFLDGKPCIPHTAYPFRPGDLVRIPNTVIRLVGGAEVVPSWAGGEPGLVERLARCVRDDGDFGTIPILADALEDAGCTDPAILGHLRGPGPHIRTCWVLEAILGRDDAAAGVPSPPPVEPGSVVIYLVEESVPGSGQYELGLSSTFRGNLVRYLIQANERGYRALSASESSALDGKVEGLRGRLLGWEAKHGRIFYECAEEPVFVP